MKAPLKRIPPCFVGACKLKCPFFSFFLDFLGSSKTGLLKTPFPPPVPVSSARGGGGYFFPVRGGGPGPPGCSGFFPAASNWLAGGPPPPGPLSQSLCPTPAHCPRRPHQPAPPLPPRPGVRAGRAEPRRRAAATDVPRGVHDPPRHGLGCPRTPGWTQAAKPACQTGRGNADTAACFFVLISEKLADKKH